MIDLTPERIREIAGAALLAGSPGKSRDDDVPGRAVVDSRQARRGDLFVGVPGEHADGGEFAEQAVEAGAWGVLLSPQHALRIASTAPRKLRVLSVEDPLAALGRLSRAWVDRLWAHGCKVVAITGSTGKTSTKDILVALLRPVFGDALAASPRNYNTEVGVPLAVLDASPDTKVLVLEMAMRGPGQITELCEIAPPQVGVITNVGPVHLELLGSVEAIASAKAELIAALPPDGICVVPADAEALHPHLRSEVRTLTFGHDPSAELDEVERVAGAAADVRALAVEPATVEGKEGLRAQIAVGAEKVTLELNFSHAHNLLNALAAIGAAHALGVETERLPEGARQVELSELRGEEIELGGGAVVINDCYNANPISMRAALDHLSQTAARREGVRTVAVLGDMAELGDGAREFHLEVGAYAARSGVGALVVIGELAEAYAEGYGGAGEVRRAATADDAAALLAESMARGDVVLIKGSRSMGLERIAERLSAADGRGEG